MWIYNSRLVPKGYVAITLWPFVFTKLAKDQVSDRLRKHEEKHLEQARKGFVIGFYLSYLWEYVKLRITGLNHFEAYYLNPYEVEARDAENG